MIWSTLLYYRLHYFWKRFSTAPWAQIITENRKKGKGDLAAMKIDPLSSYHKERTLESTTAPARGGQSTAPIDSLTQSRWYDQLHSPSKPCRRTHLWPLAQGQGLDAPKRAIHSITMNWVNSWTISFHALERAERSKVFQLDKKKRRLPACRKGNFASTYDEMKDSNLGQKEEFAHHLTGIHPELE